MTTTKMELKILQFNINSLLAHIRELKQFLSKNSYDLVCIQETFLKTKHKIKFPGYTVVRTDRPDTTRGGGLLILAKEGLRFTKLDVDCEAEHQAIKLYTESGTLVVVNLYLPSHRNK